MAVQYDKNELIKMIAQNSTKVKPSIMLSVADVESNFTPSAKNSKSSAGGMYQMTDAAAKQFGLEDRFDPMQSTLAAQKYLSTALKRYNGDEDKAILSYYAGMGNVDRHGLDTKAMGLDGHYLNRIKEARKKYMDYDNAESFDVSNDTQIASYNDDNSKKKGSLLEKYGFNKDTSVEDLEKELGIFDSNDENNNVVDNFEVNENSSQQLKDPFKMTQEELENELFQSNEYTDQNNIDESDNFILPPDDFSEYENVSTKIEIPDRPDFSNNFKLKTNNQDENKRNIEELGIDPSAFGSTKEQQNIENNLIDKRDLNDDQIFDMFKENNFDMEWAIDNLTADERKKLVNKVSRMAFENPEDQKKIQEENGRFKNFAAGTAIGATNLMNSLYDNFALLTNNESLKKDAEKKRKIINFYNDLNEAGNPDRAVYNAAGQLTSEIGAGFAIPITRFASFAKGTGAAAKTISALERLPKGQQISSFVRNSNNMKKFGSYVEKGTNYAADAALYSAMLGVVDTDGKVDSEALAKKAQSMGGDALMGGLIGVAGERVATTIFNKYHNWKELKKAAKTNNFPQEVQDKIKYLEDNGLEYNIAYFNDPNIMKKAGTLEEIQHIARNDEKTNKLIDRNKERFETKISDTKKDLDMDRGVAYSNQKKKLDDLRNKSQNNKSVSNELDDIEEIRRTKSTEDNNAMLKNDIALNYLNHKIKSDELYSNADKLIPKSDKTVVAKNTMSEFEKLIDQNAKSALSNSASDEALKAVGFNKESIEKFKKMGIEEFNETIKTLNSKIYDDKNLSRTAKKSLTDIKSALMKDKDEFFETIGGKDYKKAKAEADKYFSENVASIRNDKQLKNMISMRDEKGNILGSDKIIDNFMTSGKADETKLFYNKLSTEGKQYFKQGAIDHMFNKAMKDGKIDIKKLNNIIDNMNSKSSNVSPIDVVLNQTEKNNIKDLLEVYKTLQVAEANRLKSSTGKSVDQRISDENPLLKGMKTAVKYAGLTGSATIGAVLGVGSEKLAKSQRNKLIKAASDPNNRHLFFRLANETPYSQKWDENLEKLIEVTNRYNSQSEEE